MAAAIESWGFKVFGAKALGFRVEASGLRA